MHTSRNPRLQSKVQSLQENKPVTFTHMKGWRIECLSGTAWITAFNELDDIILRPGDKFQIPNDGLTLIEAVGMAQVCIKPAKSPATPPRGGWLQRTLEWRHPSRVTV